MLMNSVITALCNSNSPKLVEYNQNNANVYYDYDLDFSYVQQHINTLNIVKEDVWQWLVNLAIGQAVVC